MAWDDDVDDSEVSNAIFERAEDLLPPEVEMVGYVLVAIGHTKDDETALAIHANTGDTHLVKHTLISVVDHLEEVAPCPDIDVLLLGEINMN